MKVAAFQAPLSACSRAESVVPLIRDRVCRCEAEGVHFLCCPEAVLGGLADDAADPADFALGVESGQLASVLAPLASDAVTTIMGFTERAGGRLYNSAAVFHRGAVAGVYRKLHPAIRRSVYQAGDQTPVFTLGGLTFGIVICYDSNFPEPAKAMASQGAKVLFIPTNNGLPAEKADVVVAARNADVALALANRMWVVRADVAGRSDGRVSFGSSGIVGPDGTVLRSAKVFTEDMLVAEIDPRP
jgi:predicted amidohydrolase